MMKLILYIVAILLFAQSAFATTYYVAPDGSGSDSDSGQCITDEGACGPWATMKHAFEQSVAGDVVYYLAGTHTISSLITLYGGTGADGTAESPITHKAYPGATVTIVSNVSPFPFDINKNYWTIEDLNFQGTNGVFRMNNATTGKPAGWKFINDTFTLSEYYCTDGGGAIQANSTTADMLVDGCTFVGPGTSSCNASVITFSTNNIRIQNCDVSGFNNGIYAKHSNDAGDTQSYIKNCYIHDNDAGIRLDIHDAEISNNLIVDNRLGIQFDTGSGGTISADNNTFNHNTIYSSTTSVNQEHSDNGAQYNDYRNSIFDTMIQLYPYTSTPHYTTFGYNLYVPSLVIRDYSTSYTLANYQTYLGGCPDADNSCYSYQATPTFVGGATPTTIAGFALTAESVGYHAASDGDDMGVDVSLVGTNIPPSTVSRGTVPLGNMR